MTQKKPEFVGGDSEKGIQFPKIVMPSKVRIAGIFVLLLLILCGALYSMFLEYVRPNEYGIKEVQIGINKGIQEKVYEPGLAFVMPFGFQMIHRLPRNVQVLELTDVTGANQGTAAARNSSVYYDRPAKIQTSDGFFVDVDATILYRIMDPYLVVTKLGPEKMFLDQGILPKAEPILKEALGRLTTEEFYNSPLRAEKAEEARKLLDAEMQPKGIEVHQVLVRYFKYSPQIQENIEAKKLQDQLVYMNQSKKKAAIALQGLNKMSMEGTMKVAVTAQEGEAYKVKKAAEKNLYVRKMQADADLLVQLAEARSTEMRNAAMQVVGVDKLVGKKMAEVLRGLEVVVLPSGGANDFNPLDLDSVLKTFGVSDTGGPPGNAVRPAVPHTTQKEAVQ